MLGNFFGGGVYPLRRVAELRETLVEEGRRRRHLYDEKRWAAQSELRRVLAESNAVQEKERTLRLLLQVRPGNMVFYAIQREMSC